MDFIEFEREIPRSTFIGASSLTEKEGELAHQLKQICDKDGREINLRKSSFLLHQMAKEYQSLSPDMFSLVRSATLYNAAIQRSPDLTTEIEQDLTQLCTLILREANAKYQDADLLSKSRKIKLAVAEWRKNIEHELSKIKRIPDAVTKDKLQTLEEVKIYDIRRIQNQIVDKYLLMMAEVAAFCENVMGDAPYDFAIAGMGSIAKKEITPYSDFEHIILLSNAALSDENYKENLNYYRWFSVIFQIILINLGETIIPSVAVYSLNNEKSSLGNWFYDGVTPSGISFDGMMLHACKFPLGRQQPTKNKPWKTELIKPVDEMLNYLSSEENLKNGYHLSDILTKSCFVYKTKAIFDEFEQGVFQKLQRDIEDGSAQEEIKKQLAEDLAKFAVRTTISKLKTVDKLNVKQVVYRTTTLFISALGRMHNIEAFSSFEIVEELAKRKLISDYAGHMLKYAIAIACEVRLRWYMERKKQCDVIDSNPIATLLRIVGKASTMKYFRIAYALQCDIAKRLKLKKQNFYSNPCLLNLNSGQCFHDDEQLQTFAEHLKNQGASIERLYDFDNCMQAMELPHTSTGSDVKPIPQCVVEIQQFAIKLFRLGLYDDVLECFEYVSSLYQESGESEQAHPEYTSTIAYNYFLMGRCMEQLNKSEKALEYFLKCLNIFQQTSSNRDNAEYWIGRCLLRMKNYERAYDHFKTSLDLVHELTSNENADKEIAKRNYWIGICLVRLKRPAEATVFFEESLQVMQHAEDAANDNEMADVNLWLGKLKYIQNNITSALDHFESSLETKQEMSVDGNMDQDIAETLYWIGLCSVSNKSHDEAISYFKRAIALKEPISLDYSTDTLIAKAQLAIGECLILQGSTAEETIKYFEKAFDNVEQIYHDLPCMSTFQDLLYICLTKLKKTEKALEFFERLLEIERRWSTDETDLGSNLSIVETLDWISKCFLDMNNVKEAREYLLQSIAIYANFSPSTRCHQAEPWIKLRWMHSKFGQAAINQSRRYHSSNYPLRKVVLNVQINLVIFAFLSASIFLTIITKLLSGD